MKEPLLEITDEDAKRLLACHKRVQTLRRVIDIASPSDNISLKSASVNLREAESLLADCWQTIADKYRLKTVPAGRWTIDFHTNIIYLIS